jgi:phospholipid/cholesterol/gamma-HCH transport system permease protein
MAPVEAPPEAGPEDDDDDALGGFAQVARAGGATVLTLTGRWTVENAAAIEKMIEPARRKLGRGRHEVDAAGIERLDTCGALLLKRLLPDGTLPRRLSADQRDLLEFLPPFAEYEMGAADAPSRARAALVRIGAATVGSIAALRDVFVFIGRIAVCLLHSLGHPRHLRPAAIVRHIQETGPAALLIVGLLAVLISMVITYQGAVQLRKFGAGLFTIDLTVVALLREMSVLVTAIMVAGRSGSAFAAELGVMKLRDEINALTTIGIDPIEALVVPRVLALTLTLPLLTFMADIIGLAAGGVLSLSLLGIPFDRYLARVESVADPTMFFVGMIKAPVFAFLIAVVGCYQGLNVTGSAESIGRMTTLSVVQSIFLVILADAIFSVVFSQVGI